MIPEIIDSHVHFLDPDRLTYPWLTERAFPQPCDAVRYAAEAPAITGAIVVEAGTQASEAGNEAAWIRSQAAARCPDTMIVLDHLGKPRCGDEISAWQAALRAVAKRPNVVCKLSGLVTDAHPAARPADMIAAIRAALELFGPSRCMYGGDWPLCSRAIGQQAWLDLVREALSEASPGEQEQVLARTARQSYQPKRFCTLSPH